MGHIIKAVPEGSLGFELGLQSGDELLKINGEDVIDVIDYQALLSAEELTLTYLRGGETNEVSCDKEDWEELGVEFEGDMLETRVCKNHCVFCFIDQMAKSCRKSLYVKDDDWRMSLMMGNFVTLTNVDDKELDRIVRRHASPLYISVHSTDPEVRKAMMRNPNAGKLMAQLRTLQKAGISFHAQVVLCPGLNDGEVLEKTISDLYAMYPACQSVAVVPVGLTGFREGLYPLEPVTESIAREIIKQLSKWQKKCWNEHGTRFVFPSDEFYCLAGKNVPNESCYEDFPQIENGVGLVAQLKGEFDAAMEGQSESPEKKHYIIATGVSAAPQLSSIIGKYIWRNLDLEIIAVENQFFGGHVTVTGLLTGSDLIRELKGVSCDAVLISESMLRAEQDLFLDDKTLDDVEEAIGARLYVVENDGAALADVLLHGIGG